MNEKLGRYMMKELIAVIAGMALLTAVPLTLIIVGS